MIDKTVSKLIPVIEK